MEDKLGGAYEINFLDRFIFGFLICDLDFQIKYMNYTAELIIKNSASLYLRDGKLLTTSSEIHENFYQNIERLKSKNVLKDHNQNLETTTNFFVPYKDENSLYIQVTKLDHLGSSLTKPTCSVLKFVLSDLKYDIKICPNTLQELYGLTNAEARVLYHVVLGRSLIETAQILELSEGTVRTHIKRIFSKTNTHRQNELLHLVLTNPIWFASTLS